MVLRASSLLTAGSPKHRALAGGIQTWLRGSPPPVALPLPSSGASSQAAGNSVPLLFSWFVSIVFCFEALKLYWKLDRWFLASIVTKKQEKSF